MLPHSGDSICKVELSCASAFDFGIYKQERRHKLDVGEKGCWTFTDPLVMIYMCEYLLFSIGREKQSPLADRDNDVPSHSLPAEAPNSGVADSEESLETSFCLSVEAA